MLCSDDVLAHQATIRRVVWLDHEGQEAEVLVELGGQALWAFCHPCDFREQEVCAVAFDGLEADISETAFWQENAAQRRAVEPAAGDQWRHHCYGQIQRLHPVTVACGPLTLALGDRVTDERAIGAFVYCVMARLDVFRF